MGRCMFLQSIRHVMLKRQFRSAIIIVCVQHLTYLEFCATFRVRKILKAVQDDSLECFYGLPRSLRSLSWISFSLVAVLDFLLAQLCRSFGFASTRFELRSPGFTRTKIRFFAPKNGWNIEHKSYFAAASFLFASGGSCPDGGSFGVKAAQTAHRNDTH